jgi:lysophospholipase L1-like esterase
MQNKNRRDFLRFASLGALTGITFPSFAEKTTPSFSSEEDSLTILFQGDSITDAWRRREFYYPNDSPGMGLGYVHQAVSELVGKYPHRNLRCYNRGVGGDKVHQLAKRWQDDCLQLQPDVLSILIGVNDFWHTLSHNYKGTVATYEGDFRKLLDRTKEKLPNVQLIIAEPFVVKGGTAITEKDWFPAFSAYQEAAKKVASDYKAHFIPLQSIFDEALSKADVAYWCPDGVHPSLAGNYLMAQAWLKVIHPILLKS